MKVRVLRRLVSWTARATSSLPVPVSPSSRTVASVGATVRTWCRTPASARLLPHDLLELVTPRHLVLEVDLLVVEPIAQRRDLLVRQRVLDRDGQRLRHLLQQQDLVG